VQPLTAAPRQNLTDDQVTALLTAPDVHIDYGVELLNASLAVVADISADVVSWVVHHDNLANVHGTLDLTISRALAWGYDRVRPYMLLTSSTGGPFTYSDTYSTTYTDIYGEVKSTPVAARFNQGVYLLTTPDTQLSETPVTYTATGYDQLHLLQAPIGDSYFVAAGSNVLAAVKAALTAAGVVAPVNLDSSSDTAVLASNLVFPLTSSTVPTWIQVVNTLLAAIYYRGIWCDWDGVFRSNPYVNPADRAIEFTFPVGDLLVGVVAADRTVTNDVWGAPNRWIGIQNGLTVAPAEGVGKYTTDNTSTGLSSQTSVGRIIPDVQYYDAVNQASLVSQVNAVKAADMRSTEVITAKLGPFPVLWHADVVAWQDTALGGGRTAIARSWSLPCDGSDGDLILETI
jgi:hypothetical protein